MIEDLYRDYSRSAREVCYIFDKCLDIDKKITSPQSALLLSDMYDELIIEVDQKNLEEQVFGCVLLRKEEEHEDFVRYKYILEEYIAYNIKRYTGLTLEEYLNLNVYESKMYKKTCLKMMEKDSEVMSDVERDSDKKIKSMRVSDNLDELLNGG